MAGDTFESWKHQCLNKCDFSKKGSVDGDISHIVSFINSHDKYFTTSSCSGRIILFDGVRMRSYLSIIRHQYVCQKTLAFKEDILKNMGNERVAGYIYIYNHFD